MAKRPDPPAFPLAFLIAALALIADLAGLTCLFLSNLPLLLKLCVGGALVAVPFGSLTYFAGRKRQWNQMRGYVNALEREVRQLRGKLPAEGANAREAA